MRTGPTWISPCLIITFLKIATGNGLTYMTNFGVGIDWTNRFPIKHHSGVFWYDGIAESVPIVYIFLLLFEYKRLK
jgi:hypothetical protein